MGNKPMNEYEQELLAYMKTQVIITDWLELMDK